MTLGPPSPTPPDDLRRRIADGRMLELYDYWQDKRGDRPMPARTDIDLLDLPVQLPNLFLVDIEPSPPRYRYRLIGSNLTDVLKEDLTGRYVDEMPWLFRRYAEPAYEDLVATERPHYKEVRIVRAFWCARYRRLMLPLGKAKGPIDMALGCIYKF